MRTVKFNLKAALKNPERVVYRNGEKPIAWAYFKKANKDSFCIVSIDSEGEMYNHYKTGNCCMWAYHFDLLLLSEPKVKK